MRTQERLFWRLYQSVPIGDGCWEWPRARKTDGYGHVKIDGRLHAAHRLSWQLTNGPIPDGMYVCHRCDNPPCVRPDHLFLGTAKDNAHDMIAKGRNYAEGLRNTRTPVCPRGHEREIYGGRWRCRVCHIERQRERTA